MLKLLKYEKKFTMLKFGELKLLSLITSFQFFNFVNFSIGNLDEKAIM